MSDDRHISSETRSDAAHLLVAAARQRSVAVDDLFLPEASRLGEWLRTMVRELLGRYVRAVETELRAALAENEMVAAHDALLASLSSAHVQIALPLLERAAAFRDAELIAIVIRRAEEHRFFRAGGAPADQSLLSQLVGDDDVAIAGQAMGLLIAQSRRFDRFQEPLLASTELPADIQHRLAWTIAAALRVYMVEHHGIAPAAADRAVAAAAERLLAGYDEGETLESRCARLAMALHDRGRLADDMIVRALDDGNLPLFVAMLAARTGLAGGAVAEIAAERRGRGVALLLRAGGIGRDAAAAILVRFTTDGAGTSPTRDAKLEAQLDLFDVTDPEAAEQMLALWRIDPSYRSAMALLLDGSGAVA